MKSGQDRKNPALVSKTFPKLMEPPLSIGILKKKLGRKVYCFRELVEAKGNEK